VQDEALLRHTEEEEAGNTVAQRVQRMLPLRTQPRLLKGGKLRDYQLEGVNWLASLYANGANGILADEMGLGKTVQTVAMLGLLMECGAQGPFLILAPKSTLSNWANELAAWLPEARVLHLQGTKEERQALISEVLRPGKFDVVLTSYEMMLRESGELTRRYWRYVAIDEAHRIKNEESMLSLVTRQLQTNGRLLITGTPLQNNLHELWALLNFLLPDEFHSAEDFHNFFSPPDAGDGANEGAGDAGGRGLQELQV
jgi:SWI/SNF-related matrix-associated actin-dependent regulator of chromatin subfamily A member 5